jgi:hypothetical protein
MGVRHHGLSGGILRGENFIRDRKYSNHGIGFASHPPDGSRNHAKARPKLRIETPDRNSADWIESA